MSGLNYLPLREVTLYNNGYGIFVRKGEVKGSGSIDLYFPREDMPRVLKSLCLYDQNKTIGNVSYTSSAPVSVMAIDKQSPLTALFNNLQGTTVKILLEDSSEHVGKVLGVETIRSVDSSKKSLTLLLENEGIRLFNLDLVHETHIMDPDVLGDVSHSINIEKNAKKSDMQKITVFYRGGADDPARFLTVKYGIQCKEWVSSYRIVLDDKDPTQLQLDGFAIVQNTLQEDWDDVSLTLVSGAPLLKEATQEGKSHGSTLIRTLELTIKELSGSSFSVRANPRDTVDDLKEEISSSRGLSAKRISLIFAGKSLEDGRHLSDYNIQNGATLHLKMLPGFDGDSGDSSSSRREFIMASAHNLSKFPIAMPVSAQRKQSAIVPLLHELLRGQQVVLYDENILKGNPVCALVFLNTTSRTLEGGSLQVMNGDEVLGEGELFTMHPGDESVPIPYALELGCEVAVDYDSSKLPVTSVEIKNGELTFVRSKKQITKYTIVNKTANTLDFMLNHPYLDSWELQSQSKAEEEEPVDITDKHYQFRFPLKARSVSGGIVKNEKKEFRVVEVTPTMETHDLSYASADDLASWGENYLDKPTVSTINKIFDLKKEINQLAKEIYDKEGKVREIQNTQDRLRKNITTLDKHATGAEKYIKSLAQEEDHLTGLYAQIDSIKEKKKALDNEFNRRIKEVAFKRKISSSSA